MSLLRRMDSILPLIHQRDVILRALLKRLSQDEQGMTLLKDVLVSTGLHESTRGYILKNPVEHLFPGTMPLERPADGQDNPEDKPSSQK